MTNLSIAGVQNFSVVTNYKTITDIPKNQININFNNCGEVESSSPDEFTSCDTNDEQQTVMSSKENQNKIYDQNGNLIQNNVGIYTINYEYDENGIKTKETKKFLPDVDGADWEISTYFNTDGKAVRETWSVGVGNEKTVYNGQIEETTDNETGLATRILKNDKGQLLLKEIYDKDGQVIRKESGKNLKEVETYEYNKQGLLIKIKSNNATSEYKYNNQNQLVSETMTSGKNKSITKYEYNNNNQIYKVKEYINNKLQSSLDISYDEKGNEFQRKYVNDGIPYRLIKYKNDKVISDKDLY